jgi:hypothetical protein
MRPYRIISADENEVHIYVQSKKFNRICSNKVRIALEVWTRTYPTARINLDISDVTKLYASSFVAISHACRLKFDPDKLRSNVTITVGSEELKTVLDKALFNIVMDIKLKSDNEI